VGPSLWGSRVYFQGAAQCLAGALLVNPWHEKKLARLINEVLNMPADERALRHQNNFDYVKTHTSRYWMTSFLKELLITTPSIVQPDVDRLNVKQLKRAYQIANKRIIFIDYDGTLTPIVKMPHLARPSEEILKILKALGSDKKNIVYVVSGRDRKFLEEYLSEIPIGLSGEHGSFLRPCPKPGGN
jgi:hypothetical protein